MRLLSLSNKRFIAFIAARIATGISSPHPSSTRSLRTFGMSLTLLFIFGLLPVLAEDREHSDVIRPIHSVSFGKFASLLLVDSSPLDEDREYAGGNGATSGDFAHMANGNTTLCSNSLEVVRGKEAREVLESRPYVAGELRRVNVLSGDGVRPRSSELWQENSCYPLAEGDGLRFTRVEDEVIEAGLIDYGNALFTTKGVGNGDPLFVVVEVGNSIPVVCDFENLANFGRYEYSLPVFFGNRDEALAELETAMLGEREINGILHKCFGFELCGTIKKRCATSRCSGPKTGHLRPLQPQNGVSTPQMLLLTSVATQNMIDAIPNAMRYVLGLNSAKLWKNGEKSKYFVQIFRQCTVEALVGNDAPMAWAVNHVPNEVDLMYETVAEDEDLVLVHEAVANFKEPGAVGGVKSALISFSVIA